jgi:type VI secretion system secreted protein Hcp
MRRLIALVAAFLCLSVGATVNAEWDIWLALRIDGNDVEGSSSVTSMGRGDQIRLKRFDYQVETPRDEATGALTGKRQHKPIKLVKQVDKTSPLLFKALCNNEPVDRAEFRFFRRLSDKTEHHYQTIVIEKGYVASYRQVTTKNGMFDIVTFVYRDITITYESNGASHRDSAKGE